MSSPDEIKMEILRLTREYTKLTHSLYRPGADPERPKYQAGQTVPYAGRVFAEDEVAAAISSTLDFWLTLGPEGAAFESEFAAMLGVKHTILVNSGSSANLVALATLTTPKLPAHRRICPGDEVITVAAGFPTTVAPIVQIGAIPVFIDNDPVTGNARVEQLEAALIRGRTKAVMMAHTLGNPFNIGEVLAFCRRHDLWLIEDNCDSLGSIYSMPVPMARTLGLDHLLKLAETRTHGLIRIEGGDLFAPTGTWGDLSTQSFYPPHHLTMGEGGAVNIVSRPPLKTYAESFRDWGRDCWCASGIDNTCGKRFQWHLGELPEGYDHKYIYSHFGYNLKPLDPQAAIGRVQLRRLPAFIAARRDNWSYLRGGLADLDDFFEFTLPSHAVAWTPSGMVWDASGCRSDCSWFGFMLRTRPNAPFTCRDLARRLDERKIGNRMLFGGNLLRQPVFLQLRKDRPNALRVIDSDGLALSPDDLERRLKASVPNSANPEDSGQRTISPLPGADVIMNRSLFLGTYPGLTTAMLDYEIHVIREFVGQRSSA